MIGEVSESQATNFNTKGRLIMDIPNRHGGPRIFRRYQKDGQYRFQMTPVPNEEFLRRIGKALQRVGRLSASNTPGPVRSIITGEAPPNPLSPNLEAIAAADLSASDVFGEDIDEFKRNAMRQILLNFGDVHFFMIIDSTGNWKISVDLNFQQVLHEGECSRIYARGPAQLSKSAGTKS